MGWGWGLGNFEIFSKESVGPPFHFVQNSPDPSPLKVTIVQDGQSNIQQQETDETQYVSPERLDTDRKGQESSQKMCQYRNAS